jgi:beta-1,4-N-acetylglucosaminyltransferase
MFEVDHGRLKNVTSNEGRSELVRRHRHYVSLSRRTLTKDQKLSTGLLSKKLYQAMSGQERTIFVTVGTTLFEALIEAAIKEEALKWMEDNGYTKLIIQYGKGKRPTLPASTANVQVEVYDFKPNLSDDMERADLIIGHAGAGTVMEATGLKKRMVVVINTILMHNHQTELANAMGSRNHVYVIHEPAHLANLDTWDAFEKFDPVPLPPGDDDAFPRLLNSFLGFPTLDKDE